MNVDRKDEAGEVYAKARTVSASKAWSTLLSTTRDRVRFEDGYVAGWFAHKHSKKHKPTTHKEVR